MDLSEEERESRVGAMDKFFASLCGKTLSELGVSVIRDGKLPERKRNQYVPRAKKPQQLAKERMQVRMEHGFAGPSSTNKRSVEILIKKTTTKLGVRQEWMLMEYDSVYDPNCVYQIQLRWLVASGLHVEEWIAKNLLRKSKTLKDRVGVQMVQVPGNEYHRTANAFHTPLQVHLPQQRLRKLAMQFLREKCGFVMEHVPPAHANRVVLNQLMHHTGMAVVRRNFSHTNL
jgi:hypothetical protein